MAKTRNNDAAEEHAHEMNLWRSKLEINKNALDDALLEQPSLYYQVSEAYVRAVAKRDSCKLDMDNLKATLDQDFRTEAIEAEEKFTEASIKNRVASAPEMMQMEQKFLHTKARCDELAALKEAFGQRSYMLRELVSLYTTQYYERDLTSPRNKAADETRKRAGDLRRERHTAR